jgi:hypothetical protein
MAYAAGRTGADEDITATGTGTALEVFNSLLHDGPVRGMVITGGVETLFVNIPLLHKTSWVAIGVGETFEFYAPFRGMDSVFMYSAGGTATASWYPNLA